MFNICTFLSPLIFLVNHIGELNSVSDLHHHNILQMGCLPDFIRYNYSDMESDLKTSKAVENSKSIPAHFL